jgi:hypothetical protein
MQRKPNNWINTIKVLKYYAPPEVTWKDLISDKSLSKLYKQDPTGWTRGAADIAANDPQAYTRLFGHLGPLPVPKTLIRKKPKIPILKKPKIPVLKKLILPPLPKKPLPKIPVSRKKPLPKIPIRKKQQFILPPQLPLVLPPLPMNPIPHPPPPPPIKFGPKQLHKPSLPPFNPSSKQLKNIEQRVQKKNDYRAIAVFDFDNTILATNLSFFVSKPKKYIETFWNVEHVGKSVYKLYSEQQLLAVSKKFRKPGGYVLKPGDKYVGLIVDVFWGGQIRLRYMYDFFQKLRYLSVDLYISSNARCDLIINFLQMFNMLQFFADENGEFDYNRINAKSGDCLPGEKDVFIEYLHHEYPDQKIYYIDDDPKYKPLVRIDKSHFQYFGKNIGLERGGSGLTHAMISSIYKTIIKQTPNFIIGSGQTYLARKNQQAKMVRQQLALHSQL